MKIYLMYKFCPVPDPELGNSGSNIFWEAAFKSCKKMLTVTVTTASAEWGFSKSKTIHNFFEEKIVH